MRGKLSNVDQLAALTELYDFILLISAVGNSVTQVFFVCLFFSPPKRKQLSLKVVTITKLDHNAKSLWQKQPIEFPPKKHEES